MTDARHNMKQIQLKDVQENFEQIFEDVLVSGEPVEILKETGNAILVSEEVWRGMTETLNLVSIPGVRETIRFGMREPITDTKTGLDWYGETVVDQYFNGTRGFLRVLESKVFANGSTTLPKSVRNALSVEAGDTVRYVISEQGVQVLRTRSVGELAGMLARDGHAVVSVREMENAIMQGVV